MAAYPFPIIVPQIGSRHALLPWYMQHLAGLLSSKGSFWKVSFCPGWQLVLDCGYETVCLQECSPMKRTEWIGNSGGTEKW